MEEWVLTQTCLVARRPSTARSLLQRTSHASIVSTALVIPYCLVCPTETASDLKNTQQDQNSSPLESFYNRPLPTLRCLSKHDASTRCSRCRSFTRNEQRHVFFLQRIMSETSLQLILPGPGCRPLWKPPKRTHLKECAGRWGAWAGGGLPVPADGARRLASQISQDISRTQDHTCRRDRSMVLCAMLGLSTHWKSKTPTHWPAHRYTSPSLLCTPSLAHRRSTRSRSRLSPRLAVVHDNQSLEFPATAFH